jgi:hypothetical protein
VQHGSVRLERRARIEDGGQVLVLDVDEPHRLLRGLARLGGDGGDPLPDEPDDVRGQHRQVAQLAAVPDVSEIRPGEDGDDAGQLLGGRGVDRDDPRVRHRAGQAGDVQDAVRVVVAGVARLAGHLEGALVAHLGTVEGGAHAAASCSSRSSTRRVLTRAISVL